MIKSLLTKEEVADILRLNNRGVKDPIESLRYLVRTGQIEAVKICGQLMFEEDAVREYIQYCKAKS